MAERAATSPVLRFRTKTRRTGNSVAVIIPADAAKRAGLQPEREVDVEIRLTHESPLGFLRRRGLSEAQIDEIGRGWKQFRKELWPDE